MDDVEVEYLNYKVFDFNYEEVTWENFITILHDTIYDYKRLSQSFEKD